MGRIVKQVDHLQRIRPEIVELRRTVVGGQQEFGGEGTDPFPVFSRSCPPVRRMLINEIDAINKPLVAEPPMLVIIKTAGAVLRGYWTCGGIPSRR